MPAPGSKDGHSSKASRDLGGHRGLPREIKNVAVKSNGFKGGAFGAADGKGRNGVRLGEGGSARSIDARKRLREVFERRKHGDGARKEARKRARTAGGEATVEAAATATVEATATATATVEAATEETTKDDDEGNDTYAALEASGYFCAACQKKCATRNNWESHVASRKHREAAERERGREILASLKRRKLEAAGVRDVE